jgi:hypothetical protein
MLLFDDDYSNAKSGVILNDVSATKKNKLCDEFIS